MCLRSLYLFHIVFSTFSQSLTLFVSVLQDVENFTEKNMLFEQLKGKQTVRSKRKEMLRRKKSNIIIIYERRQTLHFYEYNIM